MFVLYNTCDMFHPDRNEKNGSCLWIIVYSILLIPLSRIINLHILMACKCVTKCVFSILCLVKKIFYLTGIYIFHHHRVVMVNLNVKVASFFTCVLSRSVTILQIETKYNLQTYIQSKTKIINDSKVVTKDREILLLNRMKYVTEQTFYPEDTLSFLYYLKIQVYFTENINEHLNKTKLLTIWVELKATVVIKIKIKMFWGRFFQWSNTLPNKLHWCNKTRLLRSNKSTLFTNVTKIWHNNSHSF